MKNLVLGIAAILLAVPSQADDFNAPLENIISGYFRPAAADFSESAGKLPNAVSAICTEATEANVLGFQTAFSATIRDFSRIQFLRFGPLLEDDRLSRLSFRPDPRGRAQKQIRKLYAAADNSVLSPVRLGKKSVAVQSLTALELIAFNKDTEVVLGNDSDNKDYTCGYALAIAQNVSKIAHDTSADWIDPDGYSKILLSAGPDNDRYRTSKEAIEDVFNSLATGITITKDQDILPAMGKSKDKTKPNRFPFSRSGNAVVYLTGELAGINDALSSMDLKPMMSSDDQWTLDTLGFEFKNARNYLDALNPPLRRTFSENDGYNQVAALLITLSSIQELMTQGVAGGLGLAGGFNALDGD